MKRSNPRFLRNFATLALLTLVFSSGCATMRANSARNAYIHQMTRDHVYQTACHNVWPTARQMLFSRGFAVKNTGEGSVMILETEWKYERDQEPVRYLVQGIQPAENQCQVNFSMNSRSKTSDRMNTNRDLDIEWQLLYQVDPQAAARISQEAEIRANAAAAEG